MDQAEYAFKSRIIDSSPPQESDLYTRKSTLCDQLWWNVGTANWHLHRAHTTEPQMSVHKCVQHYEYVMMAIMYTWKNNVALFY